MPPPLWRSPLRDLVDGAVECQRHFWHVIRRAGPQYYNLGVSLLMILPNGWMPFLDAEMLLGYKNFDRPRYIAGLRAKF